jgi:NAD(P)H dehydrogenase (quinone)
VIGHRVALSLLEAGVKDVRVGIWRGDRAVGDKSLGEKCSDDLKAKGAEVVEFDWSDPSCFRAALAGVKTIFCTIPHMDGWQEVFPAFLTEAKHAKVEHFLKISFFQADDRHGAYMQVPFVHFHSTCDDILKLAKSDSRISYTILKTTHLMSTPLIHQGPSLRKDKKFVTASYGMGVNYVSPNDVADAAIVILLNLKEHRNKHYTLTGRGPIKDNEVAKHLSKFMGEPIQHVELGYHDFKAYMLKSGHPKWLVKDSAEFEKIKASGIDERPSSYTTDLEKLIGKPPETFEDYLSNKESMTSAWSWPTK